MESVSPENSLEAVVAHVTQTTNGRIVGYSEVIFDEIKVMLTTMIFFPTVAGS